MICNSKGKPTQCNCECNCGCAGVNTGICGSNENANLRNCPGYGYDKPCNCACPPNSCKGSVYEDHGHCKCEKPLPPCKPPFCRPRPEPRIDDYADDCCCDKPLRPEPRHMPDYEDDCCCDKPQNPPCCRPRPEPRHIDCPDHHQRPPKPPCCRPRPEPRHIDDYIDDCCCDRPLRPEPRYIPDYEDDCCCGRPPRPPFCRPRPEPRYIDDYADDCCCGRPPRPPYCRPQPEPRHHKHHGHDCDYRCRIDDYACDCDCHEKKHCPCDSNGCNPGTWYRDHYYGRCTR